MRAATTVEGSGGASFREVGDFVVEAERLGLDVCWVAEAWGSDAVSTLGYLTARTERMLLGSGVLQIDTRTPAALAQAALSLAELSEGRFLLGLGTSGPQVMEGLHGVAFDKPLARMRETIEIVRTLASGERLEHHGQMYAVPRPGSDARPMRLSVRSSHRIPVYIAAMSPGMLRLTGAVADGWLGTSFVPEGSGAYFDPLREGLAGAGRELRDLDICQGAEVAIFDDEDEVQRHLATRKQELAFSLGGMGSATTNFYNRAYSRQGWAEVAGEIHVRWQAGDRAGAVGLVTDDMVLATTLIGTEDRVRERLQVWADAGVDTVRLYPAGGDLDTRLDNLARGIALTHATTRGAVAG